MGQPAPHARRLLVTADAGGSSSYRARAQAGLDALDALVTEPQLAGCHSLPAARAEFLRRLHRTDAARLADTEALMLATNQAEKAFLTERLSKLDADS